MGGIQGLKLGEMVAERWMGGDVEIQTLSQREGDVTCERDDTGQFGRQRRGWADGRFGLYDWDPAKQSVMFSLTTGASGWVGGGGAVCL